MDQPYLLQMAVTCRGGDPNEAGDDRARACAVCAAVWVSIAPVTAAASCESLSALKLPDTTITMAQSVAAGAFSPPTSGGGGGQAYSTLPAFCRVAATITPTSDSDIKVEVWLPASGWNGKYQAVGNGGWAGTITYGAMARALRDGYATSSTDTGHTGGNASFALGHPEKLVDYAYRSVHEMTVKSKAIANAFYGANATRSYFNGCSTGGRQALTAAQRFPNDFDGIVAGAAANPKSGLDAWRIWMTQAMLKDKASFIPEEKHRVIHQAVLDACDKIDGVEDGLIENPTRCRFDPAVLACRGADGPNCLTAAQVETAKVVMSPVKNRQTGELIFPGFEPGTELGWSRMLSGPEPYANAVEQFKYIVFKDPKWDWRTFNLERDRRRRRKSRPGHARCRRSEPHGVRAAWRQTPHVSRLERSEHRAASERQLLHARARGDKGARERLHLVASLHGAGDGPLQRWRGTGHVRRDERARCLGRQGNAAAADRGVEDHRREGDAYASALSVSASRTLQGHGQHRRSGELRVRRTLMDDQPTLSRSAS